MTCNVSVTCCDYSAYEVTSAYMYISETFSIPFHCMHDESSTCNIHHAWCTCTLKAIQIKNCLYTTILIVCNCWKYMRSKTSGKSAFRLSSSFETHSHWVHYSFGLFFDLLSSLYILNICTRAVSEWLSRVTKRVFFLVRYYFVVGGWKTHHISHIHMRILLLLFTYSVL